MRAVLLTLLAALALGLSACGGDDGDAPTGEEAEIQDLVERFYGNEEGVCDDVTTKLLERQFESKEACEEAAAQAAPEEEYEVDGVLVDGDEGKVDVSIGDQSGKLVVKKEDGAWKVDGIQR